MRTRFGQLSDAVVPGRRLGVESWREAERSLIIGIGLALALVYAGFLIVWFRVTRLRWSGKRRARA